MARTETAGDGYDVYRDVFWFAVFPFTVSFVVAFVLARGFHERVSGFTANTVLLILLVLFITYLVGRANDDDQWPQ